MKAVGEKKDSLLEEPQFLSHLHRALGLGREGISTASWGAVDPGLGELPVPWHFRTSLYMASWKRCQDQHDC